MKRSAFSSVYSFLFIPLLTIVVLAPRAMKPLTDVATLHAYQASPPTSTLVKASPVFKFTQDDSESNSSPAILQLIILLWGNDWLGADWLYLGFSNEILRSNDSAVGNSPLDSAAKTRVSPYPRFWVDPGPYLLESGDTIWVWGFDAGSYTIYADSLLANPPAAVAPPDDAVVSGRVTRLRDDSVDVIDLRGLRYTILLDEFTAFTVLPGGVIEPRPQDGIWLDISWLTGSSGLLGRFAPLHGDCRGYLRMDFHCP